MPIYEYECDKCGHEFEREQRMADAPVKSCPECRGRKVTKLISRSSFVLKGGGWYADGYSNDDKSQSKKPAAAENASPSTDSNGSSKSTSDSKPDTKSDTSSESKSSSKDSETADKKTTSSAKSGASKSAA